MRCVNRRQIDWLESFVSFGIVLMIIGFFWSIGQIGKPSQSHYEISTKQTQSLEAIK
jgi:hypothetical protein